MKAYGHTDLVLMLSQSRDSGSWASLARRIGVSRGFLSDIVLGRRAPGHKVLEFLGMEKIERPPLAKCYRRKPKE